MTLGGKGRKFRIVKNLATAEISILDLAKVSHGGNLRQTYDHSRELAQKAESLGYRRFWLAEHHNIEGIASAATSVLIGYIAEHTEKIRVGSGGIMLPNHAPLVIAEQFGTLASLYPERIDLGLGRAPGGDRATMRALRRDNDQAGADFGDLVEELQGFFAQPYAGQVIKAIPGAGIDVPIYILGSSLYGAQLAARLGRPFAFAGHFAPAMMKQAFEIYRSTFQPSKVLREPYVMLGVPVIAADTDEHAAYLATSVQRAFLNMVRGTRTLNLPPVEDMDSIWSPAEKHAVMNMLGLLITGSAKKVRADLDQLIEFTGADEIIVTSDTYEFKDRLHSIEVIAQAKAI